MTEDEHAEMVADVFLAAIAAVCLLLGWATEIELLSFIALMITILLLTARNH